MFKQKNEKHQNLHFLLKMFRKKTTFLEKIIFAKQHVFEKKN